MSVNITQTGDYHLYVPERTLRLKFLAHTQTWSLESLLVGLDVHRYVLYVRGFKLHLTCFTLSRNLLPDMVLFIFRSEQLVRLYHQLTSDHLQCYQ